MLLPNFLTEVKYGSNILYEAVRATEVIKSDNHKSWNGIQYRGLYQGPVNF